MLIDGDAILMRWPATTDRPFNLEARYSFPMPNLVRLEVTVAAKKELIDFEVQVGSYFDKGFPSAGVLMGDGKFVSSPAKLGTWHAFPRDAQAKAIIKKGSKKGSGRDLKRGQEEIWRITLFSRCQSTGGECFEWSV